MEYQFRPWERLAIVAAAICIVLYSFTNIILHEVNQTQAINRMISVMQQPAVTESPPNKR